MAKVLYIDSVYQDLVEDRHAFSLSFFSSPVFWNFELFHFSVFFAYLIFVFINEDAMMEKLY